MLRWLLLLLAWRLLAHAQAEPPWPRDPATGHIVFSGQLPWPDSVKTEPQRQALVRRWYRQGLTNASVAEIKKALQDGTTYAGVPQQSRYKLGIAGPDAEQFRLFFQVRLTATSTGLSYYLADFESSYISIDTGASDSLEYVLQLPDARVQRIMSGFHQQLLRALRGWR